jgi:hypothetical protein
MLLFFVPPDACCAADREDSDPRNIKAAEMVALRGFSTKVCALTARCGTRTVCATAGGTVTTLISWDSGLACHELKAQQKWDSLSYRSM